ncbi:MAG: hypothetical protein R3C59_12485 [Planctomycetaceae bacterium]
MAQPVFRYSPTDPELVDGAVFAFVEGTDPEAVLLLEARRSDGDPGWMFGFARMNIHPLQATHNKTAVWAVDEVIPPYTRPNDTFTTLFLKAPKE